MLNYSTANPPPKSRIGNKRVSFPLFSSSSSSSQSNQHDLLPGMPPILSPSNVTSIPTSHQHGVIPTNMEISDSDVQWSSEVKLKVITENIDKLLSTVSIKEDLLDKYELMKHMWSTSKLSVECQKGLFETVNTILKCEYGNAEQLKVSMLKNYNAECSPWIEFISHLINVKSS